jgi:hypothetical protein
VTREEQYRSNAKFVVAWLGVAQLERFTAAEYAAKRWRATSYVFSHPPEPTKRPSKDKTYPTECAL